MTKIVLKELSKIEIQEWQAFQDSLANILGVSIHIFDDKGLAYSAPSRPSPFCAHIRNNPDLEKICDNYARVASTNDEATSFCILDTCPFGVQSFIFKIKDKSDKLYNLFAGQFHIKDEPLGSYKNTLPEILNRHEIEPIGQEYMKILEYAKKIPEYTMSDIDEKYHYLQNIAASYIQNISLPTETMTAIKTYIQQVEYISLSHIIQEAMKILEKDISKVYSIDELLEILPVSKKTLYRGFIQYLGEPFSQCYNNIKISEAKRLLRTTSMTFDQIAIHLGYNDAKNFSKKFKKLVGMSPRDYRLSQDFAFSI
jgi:AraC-like DNA-binding protein/ligand-binding sensor protein